MSAGWLFDSGRFQNVRGCRHADVVSRVFDRKILNHV